MAEDLKRHAYEWYRAKGYSDHQAAALAGHMIAESGGNPRATHDGGTGVGIYGFRDPKPGQGRKTDLLNYAKFDPATGKPRETPLDPYALNTQLDFTHHELQGSEKGAGDRLRGAKDFKGANDAMMAYLRPQGYTAANPGGGHNYAGRHNEGATLIGADRMMGPTIAAAGGNNTPPVTPTGGILQPPPQYDPNSQDINERTRATDQLIASSQESQYDSPAGRVAMIKAEADAAKKQEDASKAFSSQASSLGQSLMAAGAPKPAPKGGDGLMQASIHQPKELAAMPDMSSGFQQQLAQSRLGGGGGVPRKRTPFDEEFG